MGRQIRFFTLEEDDRILLDISRNNDMRAVPNEIRTGEAVQPVEPLAFKRPPGSALFYLLPAGVPVGAAVYEPMNDASRSVVMPHKSALLQFMPCRHEGDAIDYGRIYFDTPRSSPWYDHVRRDFERLARRIKTWPRTDQFQFYVASAALQAVRARQLRLMHARVELHPIED